MLYEVITEGRQFGHEAKLSRAGTNSCRLSSMETIGIANMTAIKAVSAVAKVIGGRSPHATKKCLPLNRAKAHISSQSNIAQMRKITQPST